jgi:hypothetical protein
VPFFKAPRVPVRLGPRGFVRLGLRGVRVSCNFGEPILRPAFGPKR